MHVRLCRCITKIYHPCINADGLIHAECFTNQFSPALTFVNIMARIRDMLSSMQNVQDYRDYGDSYPGLAKKFDEKGKQIAREWTQQFASKAVYWSQETHRNFPREFRLQV